MARKFRGTEAAQVSKDIAAAVMQIAEASATMFASCLTCRYFDEANSFCTGYQAHPPPRIIVEACENYTDVKETPF